MNLSRDGFKSKKLSLARRQVDGLSFPHSAQRNHPLHVLKPVYCVGLPTMDGEIPGDWGVVVRVWRGVGPYWGRISKSPPPKQPFPLVELTSVSWRSEIGDLQDPHGD